MKADDVLSQLREAVRQHRLILCKHVRDRMRDRDWDNPNGISPGDIEEAILTAKGATYQPGRDTWKVTGGTDLGGEPMTLAAALNPERIVTVM